MKRGASYRRAIQELKALQASARITPPDHPLKQKRTDAYKRAKNRICERYRISVKTVYRDMKKRVPGLRKHRNDRGTVRRRLHRITIEKVGELMKAGKQHREIKARLKISGRKLLRARKRLSDRAPGQAVTNFGGEARKLIEKLFELDLIAPDRGIQLSHNGVRVMVGREDLKDIALVVANAFNRSCYAEAKKLKVDRAQLRTVMMYHLVEEQMRLAQESSDYKLVEALTRMLDRLREETQLPDDFETMVKVCQEFRADISRDEVIAVIKKVSAE